MVWMCMLSWRVLLFEFLYSINVCWWVLWFLFYTLFRRLFSFFGHGHFYQKHVHVYYNIFGLNCVYAFKNKSNFQLNWNQCIGIFCFSKSKLEYRIVNDNHDFPDILSNVSTTFSLVAVWSWNTNIARLV